MVSTPALGQITPDSSVGTTVTPNELINGISRFRINGGTIRGNNLFHSFSEFNINAGKGAYFTNPDGVSNIFSRVTGINPSNINGTLGVLGNANLFFMNPNGLLFGSGAKLDLKGSFLGTTANSINFADGSIFSTSPGSSLPTPLLSMSIPVGLGFGSNPGGITVNGTGHSLTTQLSIYSPYLPTRPTTGLQVEAGKTLALVGGDVNLNGGTLTAARGRIELGSVGAAGQIAINSTENGLSLDYAFVPSFQDLRLSRRSLASVSGASAGSIQVQGRNISLSDGSVLLSQNQGIQPSGDISIHADKLLEISGASPDLTIQSSIISETLFLGASSNIKLSTSGLILENGGALGSRSFSSGASGNITVNATEFIQMRQTGQTTLSNLIGSAGFSTGKSGNITLSTPKLSLFENSVITTATLGSGLGGDIAIDADTIKLVGANPNLISAITSDSFGVGNAGSVTLNTRTLALESGGAVSSSSAGIGGSAGSITINAAESVEVSGKLTDQFPSSIISTVGTFNPALRKAVGLPDFTIGDSGNITLNTHQLKLTQQARVSVQNFGSGNAGAVQINATDVQLDQQSGIVATTVSGEGGNIFLQASNLQLRHNSGITATAGGTGNGGNITMEVGALAQLENSNITANAVQGKGGNIQITTQGIFKEPDSNITASSQLGISGAVNISTPTVFQQNAVVEQPSNFVNTEEVVASSCLASRNTTQGKFVVTGNGGLPENPNNDLLSLYSVVPVQTTNPNRANSREQPAISSWKLGNPITEATQLVATTDGRLILTIKESEVIPRSQEQICF
jgi:filamentous hemagglutinin family protein